MNKFLILIVLLSIFVLVFLFYNLPKPKTGNFVTNMTVDRSENPLFIYEIIKYPSNVEIIKSPKNQSILVGITADPWNLNFGILQPGYGGRRFINIANYKEQPYHIRLVAYGNISPMISFSKNDFVLKKGDDVQIPVSLTTSESTNSGNYTGEIDIISEGTKSTVLGKFLGWYE